MAERYTTIRVDDLDESPGAETVRISRNGETREIDLGKRNLNRYIKRLWDEGRRVEGGSGNVRGSSAPKRGVATNRSVPTSVAGPKTDNAAIRTWARERNITVPERGRVPQRVVDQYREYEANHTVLG